MVRFISPIVQSHQIWREGKGFSKEELTAVELSFGEAKKLGIPVDSKRKSSHEENVELLKEFIEEAKSLDIKISAPKMTGKPKTGRVYQGKTSAGQKMRNLSRKK